MNVLIVTGESMYTDRNTGRSFIIVINEALYYGKKLGHSLIIPNQLQSYGTVVRYNSFDSNREMCVKTEDGDTINLISNGTNIVLYSISSTEHEFQLLPRVQLTSKFQWNPDMFQLGEVRFNAFETKYMNTNVKN